MAPLKFLSKMAFRRRKNSPTKTAIPGWLSVFFFRRRPAGIIRFMKLHSSNFRDYTRRENGCQEGKNTFAGPVARPCSPLVCGGTAMPCPRLDSISPRRRCEARRADAPRGVGRISGIFYLTIRKSGFTLISYQ